MRAVNGQMDAAGGPLASRITCKVGVAEESERCLRNAVADESDLTIFCVVMYIADEAEKTFVISLGPPGNASSQSAGHP